jgi:hypothetical protein
MGGLSSRVKCCRCRAIVLCIQSCLFTPKIPSKHDNNAPKSTKNAVYVPVFRQFRCAYKSTDLHSRVHARAHSFEQGIDEGGGRELQQVGHLLADAGEENGQAEFLGDGPGDASLSGL